MIPVSLVSDVSPDKVTLEVTADALDGFPNYESTEQKGTYEETTAVGCPRTVQTYTPASNAGYMALRKRSVPDSNVGVERDMNVVDVLGAKVGRVHGLNLEGSSRRASHIVLRQVERLSPVYRLIPVDLVADVEEDSVELCISSDYVRGLPVYEGSAEQPAG